MRKTPLLAEPSGRITYGKRLVFESGEIEAVVMCAERGDEDFSNSYFVRVQMKGGEVAKLPEPYFESRIADEEEARSITKKLAEALGVDVIERPVE